ncbi:MAG: tryptophan--tRNA ligase [Aquificota bacterium]|nr:MAG: tryptophan--tRNA ligase [Aquificota bacterium]
MERVLSGMRPTGLLHLGNYLGALKNWVDLQDEGYECFYFIADWHALTTEYADPSQVAYYCRETAIDWLAAGLDPDRSVLFLQSQVLEHAELHILLSMITPVSWLERNPTYKEIRQELKDRDLATYGFLGYPVLQAADILIYKAHYVPVGVDQLPHLELTREIARRFNYLYGNLFPEPKPKLTETPKVPGVDGRKMSKSYENAIYLSDSPQVIWDKIRPMVTDTQRKRRTDPGDPERCPVFDLHRAFTPPQEREEVVEKCKTAGFGCIDCKKILYEHLIGVMGPMYEKRKELEAQPSLVDEVVLEGSQRAREAARRTLEEVRGAVKLWRPSTEGGAE